MGADSVISLTAIHDVSACSKALALVGLVVLVTASASDLATRSIPNRLVAAGALATFVVTLAACPSSVPDRALGSLCCAGPLLVAAVLRPDGMGMGDVKLAGLIGLLLGPPAGIFAMALACAGGVLVGLFLLPCRGWSALRASIPFGPFLAGGAALAWAFSGSLA